MKFIVDQQLPRKLAAWIRAKGCEATHVRELGLEHAEDRTIWQSADATGAIIVSKDEDFSVIVGRSGGPQVVWVRLGNCGNDDLLAHMQNNWASLLAELTAGVQLIELRRGD